MGQHFTVYNGSLKDNLRTLPGNVPIDGAGHENPSFAVMGSTLGLFEGDTRLLGAVVTPLHE